MTATFIHIGTAVEHIPSTDILAGSIVVQGDLVGISIHPIPAGHLGAIQVAGVFDLPCDIGGDVSVGAKVYWSLNHQLVSLSASDGPYIGKTVRAYSPGYAAAIRVRLSQ